MTVWCVMDLVTAVIEAMSHRIAVSSPNGGKLALSLISPPNYTCTVAQMEASLHYL